MNGLLLDTNAFAMTLTDDPRLPQATRKRLLGASRVSLSVISLYEIGQKVRLGKWPGMEAHVAGLESRAREDGYDLVPLTPAAALEASMLDWSHRDPFDRLIATVARHEDMAIASSDAAFDELQLTRYWS